MRTRLGMSLPDVSVGLSMPNRLGLPPAILLRRSALHRYHKMCMGTQGEAKAAHAFVHGRVQGVGFRYWTVSVARTYNRPVRKLQFQNRLP
ncbi:MAG: acylphosphatase [Treponema sp.]